MIDWATQPPLSLQLTVYNVAFVIQDVCTCTQFLQMDERSDSMNVPARLVYLECKQDAPYNLRGLELVHKRSRSEDGAEEMYLGKCAPPIC